MKTADKIEELKSHCRENGIPLTQQRIEVYKILVGSEEHPSPEMIYGRLKNKFPTLSLATVYKNLKVLTGMGFAKKINPLSDHARYDGDIRQHSHFICLSCRRVEDVHFEELERVQIRDLPDSGHVITAKTVVYMGICKTCQDNTQEEK
jgi:Fur family peroxide stress response transcriptional regulator